MWVTRARENTLPGLIEQLLAKAGNTLYLLTFLIRYSYTVIFMPSIEVRPFVIPRSSPLFLQLFSTVAAAHKRGELLGMTSGDSDARSYAKHSSLTFPIRGIPLIHAKMKKDASRISD